MDYISVRLRKSDVEKLRILKSSLKYNSFADMIHDWVSQVKVPEIKIEMKKEDE